MIQCVKALVLKLLDGYDKHISSKVVLLGNLRAGEQHCDGEGTHKGFTAFHGAQSLVHADIAAASPWNIWDMRATYFNGHTAFA